MDCQHTLDILESARPDSSDRDEPELAAATAHLDACPQCAELFDAAQMLDRQIGRVVRDIEAPAGLRERLLAAAIAVDPPSPSVALNQQHGEPVDSSRPSRRKWLGRVTTAACCLSVGIGLWFLLRPSVVTYSVDTLRQMAADADFDTLPLFSERFQALLPSDGDWQTPYLQLTSQAGGIPAEATDHQVAVYAFRVPVSRTGSVPGLLLVIPVESVKTPPSATTFNAAVADQDQKYVWSASGTEYETVTWTSGGLVYVVAVGAGAGALESIQQAIEFTPA